LSLTKTYLLSATGLFVSSDEGSTWTDMTSFIPVGVVINHISVAESDQDVALASCNGNTVMTTYDGGASWTIVTNGTFVTLAPSTKWIAGDIVEYDNPITGITAVLATSTGRFATLSSGDLNLTGNISKPIYSVYFDGEAGLAGSDGTVHMTLDSGATWTTLNGGAVLYGADGYPGKILGLFLNTTFEWIVVLGENGVWRSDDLGLTFTKTFSYEGCTGLAFDYRLPMQMWLSGARGVIARSENNGASWEMVRGNPLMESAAPVTSISTPNGSTVLFSEGDTLWQLADGEELALKTGDPDPKVFTAPNPGLTTCYTLTDCNGLRTPFYTDEDLSAYLGAVITFEEVDGVDIIPHPGCWQVTLSYFNCTNSATYLPDITVTSSVRTCSECKQEVCYRLTNCETPTELLAGNTLFADFVGKVIKICTLTGAGPECICYSVEEETDCSFSQDLQFDGVNLYYDPIPKEDCDCCLDTPVPVPEPIPYVQSRYVVRRDFSITDLSDCEIQAIERFSTMMERRMMWLRLGIASVKPPLNQMASAEIKFRLSQLARLPVSGLCEDESPCGCC
jgi:photosystem II stability/assembly factor-like uncharacterized protein